MLSAAHATIFLSWTADELSEHSAACEVVILQRLCVLRDERGKGTGAGALALMEEHYRESGFLRIELDAKCESREFYEKQGYIVVSGVFEEAGVPHVRMLKEL